MNMKPVIGHCLGASGAVELAVALEAPVKRLWKVSLGFGGHLAAVAVARA
jgi:3-oxoacyl-(acyl-carrier-protein) synthase